MGQSTIGRHRRSLIIGGAACAAAASGLAWAGGDHTAIAGPPSGQLLITRLSASGRERQLIARDAATQAERELALESGTAFLSVAESPDGLTLAILKRVTRGSMPTDSIALYDRATLRRLTEVEVQIAFQRVPTFSIGWSADLARLAVPYNNAGRTLIFGVAGRRVALQAMIDRAYYQYHPTRPGVALHELSPPVPKQIAVIEVGEDGVERPLEQIEGGEARWSPDGAWLAYTRQVGPRPALVVRDEATRAEIATLYTRTVAKAWSPDSRRLAIYGMAPNDPLGIARYIPKNLVPGYRPGAIEPSLFVYDTDTRRATSLGALPPRFQIARLLWLGDDWLLVAGASTASSFITDRRGDQRLPITALDDYSPILGWVAA
jgi:WD40-like Beta Propeller Repeat